VHVVVLAKYVPNPSGSAAEIGPDFRLRREVADGGLDPSDEPCVEAGVRLAREYGGEVSIVSVGPERAVHALERALALGADRATLVVDPELEGADVLATATTLAAAIARRPFDLVLAGVESTDGATGTLPMTLAERLGIPSLTFARCVLVEGDRVVVERQTDSGCDTFDSTLPALVTLTAGAAEPRHPSLKESIEAKRKSVERLSLADLDLTADDVRATQRVTSIAMAPAKQAGEMIDAAEAPGRIRLLLHESAVAER
jgi:electron transfer flavoprotein beta subunit